jgi:hypothetical protein
LELIQDDLLEDKRDLRLSSLRRALFDFTRLLRCRINHSINPGVMSLLVVERGYHQLLIGSSILLPRTELAAPPVQATTAILVGRCAVGSHEATASWVGYCSTRRFSSFTFHNLRTDEKSFDATQSMDSLVPDIRRIYTIILLVLMGWTRGSCYF